MTDEQPPARSDDVALRVGRRIRRLREARGLSLSGLAARAGVGKGLLSELESGRRNPTLASLYAVAQPLGVPLAGLLGDEPGSMVDGDGARTRLLDVRAEDDGTTVEVYTLEHDPGVARSSPAHAPGVVEHLVTTRGSFRVVRHGPAGDEVHDAPQGRHVSWTSDVPHDYAAGPDGATAVLVITTPRG
ncbi:helix-turn-helix domain-containing protein [Luteimicrobium sp. DT211]|uniref:helix-turn-helix domain-containing protein n=1 Tax=Luteimicrobium sp. DT211 TaxID=3393412 RepID=UPI003CEF6560